MIYAVWTPLLVGTSASSGMSSYKHMPDKSLRSHWSPSRLFLYTTKRGFLVGWRNP